MYFPGRSRVRSLWAAAIAGVLILAGPTAPARGAPVPSLAPYLTTHPVGIDLEAGFARPPRMARLRCFWWWLNGHVTPAAITRDLEAMKAHGYGGALLFDANGAGQRQSVPVPAGPTFGTPAWRALFRHALKEAHRLDLELGLNIQSGWNLGGPPVTPAMAAKRLVWSKTTARGPAHFEQRLAVPRHRDGYYRDIVVLACKRWHVAPDDPTGHAPGAKSDAPTPGPTAHQHRPIRLLAIKTASKEFGMSAPDCSPLLEDFPAVPDEEDYHVDNIINATHSMDRQGRLTWAIPAGTWDIFRFGYTTTSARVSTSSAGWQGRVLDYLDPNAFDRYWQQVVDPLLADAGPLAGTTLKYLHTDSWECGGANWSVGFEREFRQRRGYDPRPYLPVVAGRIVEDRNVSNRFLNDLRRTIGDAILKNNYRRLARRCHERDLAIHPESGGPHGAPIDSLECLGNSDIPMSEFWARSDRHRTRAEERFFVKQPASAAHTYGKRVVAAEGFTTIGPHWEERIADNLKPTFDHALCEGLNLLFWHTFTCSPAEMGLPGQEYFAGCHFNPNVTWWDQSVPLLAYINRCQFLLQQGLFVADVCYYYGDTVPNFTQLKQADPAHVLPGYDYDVATAEVVLTRMSVRNGQITLPDGMRYRLLVLPNRRLMSITILRKLTDLVRAGATVIGPRPTATPGLSDYPASDKELTRLADRLWGPVAGKKVQPAMPPQGAEKSNQRGRSSQSRPFGPLRPSLCSVDSPPVPAHRFGAGRVIFDRSARQVLAADGVPADFACGTDGRDPTFDYVHRRVHHDDGNVDIYFVRNRSKRTEERICSFRVRGKQPELWHPDIGTIRRVPVYKPRGDRTAMPLRLGPFGSVFVVFRNPAGRRLVAARRNGSPVTLARLDPIQTKTGRIRVHPEHGGTYQLIDARGKATEFTVPAIPAPRTLDGPWTVHFPAGWGAPSSTVFKTLRSWTEHPQVGVKYFSGTATYVKTVNLPAEWFGHGRTLTLDLGRLRELAAVRINGTALGVLWKPPFAVDITAAARPGANELAIRVTNFWPNRIIGDQFLSPTDRFTRHNTSKFTKDSPLMPSGLLGPVRFIPGATAEW